MRLFSSQVHPELIEGSSPSGIMLTVQVSESPYICKAISSAHPDIDLSLVLFGLRLQDVAEVRIQDARVGLHLDASGGQWTAIGSYVEEFDSVWFNEFSFIGADPPALMDD